MWVSSLHVAYQRAVIEGYRCVNLWPAPCVHCTLLSRLSLISLCFIFGCSHHASGGQGRHDNNADNCLTDAHKRLSRRLSDRDLFMCFVNIHGSEYFVSQQSQMILSMPHLVVYMDIEWSENVNTHPNRICAYLTNIGNTMFWQCPLFSSPHPWDWSVTPYITGKLQHYHYLSPHLSPVSSDQH